MVVRINSLLLLGLGSEGNVWLINQTAEPTAVLELSQHLTFISSALGRSGNGTFCDIVSQLRQFTPDSKVFLLHIKSNTAS